MQTGFTLAQLADPNIAEANSILRACVHCGFCTATCPTYVTLGDELDSPRGRIYLIKEMLEGGEGANAQTAKHVDRCLSCLSCMTTCPSGVHYMHLVDHARTHIEETYRRPLSERALRAMLAWLLPRPGLFRLSLYAARLGRPFKALMPGRLGTLLAMAPEKIPAASTVDGPRTVSAEGEKRMRVAMFTGCAQRVLDPGINEATMRLLTRHGCEVVIPQGVGCCGALTHHMGREADALASVRANVAAWHREIADGGLDAIVINASGCGTTIKDYGFMLREDPEWADRAAVVAERARDVSEVMSDLGLATPANAPRLKVAYQAACSLQHGQKITAQPKALLAAAGFDVVEPAEPHLCCGSAGTYNLLQPDLAENLRARKLANLNRLEADVVASGNIGCMTQLSGDTVPVVHTVELLDWATGGPRPRALG
jgi:glycolate oxidase iron-sulfur subunit